MRQEASTSHKGFVSFFTSPMRLTSSSLKRKTQTKKHHQGSSFTWESHNIPILSYHFNFSGFLRISSKKARLVLNVFPNSDIPNTEYQYHIYISSSSSSSHRQHRFHWLSLSPVIPIIHLFWQVFQTTFYFPKELMKISSCWSANRVMSMCRVP